MTVKSTDDEPPRDPSMLPADHPEVPGEKAAKPVIEEEAPVNDPPPEDEPVVDLEDGGDLVNQLNKELAERRVAPAPPEAPAKEGDEKKPITKPPPGGKPPAGKKPGPKREINPKFKDLQETGKWGEISRKEIYIAIAVSLVVVIGVVVGVVVALGNNDDVSSSEPPVRPTKAPTMAPTFIGIEKEFVLAMAAIDSSDYTYLYQSVLPLTVEAYDGLMNDTSATPQERAMSWLLYEDGRDISDEAGERWALASLYYSWAGENWVSAEKWLSSENVCDWEHIQCDSITGDINEINLESNNLVGTIPPEIALLNTTQSIWLRDNKLTGSLPNEVFGSMPRLSILYLDKNQLTGTIALSIRDNDVLSKSSTALALRKYLENLLTHFSCFST